MNPSGSSAEQQHRDPSCWASAGNWEACGGLDTRHHHYAGSSRVEWDWDNAMLLSQHPSAAAAAAASDEEQDRKGHQITANLITSGLRSYDGINIPTALPTNLSSHNPIGMLSPAAMRSFGSTVDASSNFPSSSSFPGHLSSDSYFSALACHGAPRSSPAIDHRRHLFGILSIQDQKGHFNDIVKREAHAYPGEGAARIGLNLGVRTYFSTEETAAGRLVKRPRVNNAGAHAPMCQAEGCKADLGNAKHYHRRHKVCELHSKAAHVIAGGQNQRFCQQCSRFHVLSEFDDGKRSCRKRLADHNRRRRKPQPANNSIEGTPAESLALVKKEDHDQSAISRQAGDENIANSPSDPQGLLSAISLSTPVTSMNTKRPLPALPVCSQEAVYQYLQGVGQSGTHLSLSSLGGGLGLDSQSQGQTDSRKYSGIEPSAPWLRPAEVSRSDITDITVNMPHILSNENIQGSQGPSNAQIFSPSVQNLMPIESSRDLSSSDWMMGREECSQFDMNGPGRRMEEHQVLSLLEAPQQSVRDINREDGTGQRAAVEFLQQHPSLNCNDGDDQHSGNAQQTDMKFPQLQGLRDFGSSIYDSGQNML